MSLKHLNLKNGVYKILDLISSVRLLGCYFVVKNPKDVELSNTRWEHMKSKIVLSFNWMHFTWISFLKIFFLMYNLTSCDIFPLRFANQNAVFESTSFIQTLQEQLQNKNFLTQWLRTLDCTLTKPPGRVSATPPISYPAFWPYYGLSAKV